MDDRPRRCGRGRSTVEAWRRNRRLWLLGAAGGGGLVALTVLWLALPPRPGITPANYQRIGEGMSLPEVQALLGGPPGNYSQIPDKEAGLWALDSDRPDLN